LGEKGFDSLKEYCENLRIAYGAEQEERFEKYYEMLVKKNEVMNLTAITGRDEVEEKHFLDSIALAGVIGFADDAASLIDVGSGAGFPGLPLKIIFPGLRVVLLDSLGKRVDFLNEVIEELGLSGIKAVHLRAEEAAGQPEYRECFDLCVSRAVAELPVLAEYCLPFVKTGGLFVSYKSRTAEEEAKNAANAFGTLGGSLKEIRPFVLGRSGFQRSFIIVEKTAATPAKYPRAAGKARKKPL